MKAPPVAAAGPAAELRFRWPWRPYQQRVLAAVESHLRDRRLHVVAAPGAGKTTLGLEVFRLLGDPAVVLSPTRTIRDQWLRRLRDFLPEGAPEPDWTSDDLARPAFFTSATYQALHARTRVEEAEDEAPDDDDDAGSGAAPSADELHRVVAQLKQAGVRTLILDEAHHLRQEWWRALRRLAEGLPGVRLVALTGTPPYDAAGREWTRYQELCGPIDEEISVPELVRAATLAPHHDFVWAVQPGESETAAVRDYDAAVAQLCTELTGDAGFLCALDLHPFVRGAEPDPAEVLEDPEFATALLVHREALGLRQPKPLLALLGLRRRELPPLTRRWWQVLLRGWLLGGGWLQDPELQEHRRKWIRRLRDEGLLRRQELRLLESPPVKARLQLSVAKITACLDIHRLEREQRGAELRMVVLTDYIRDEGLDHEHPEGPLRLGAWPVFRSLAKAADPAAAPSLALLTGRLVVLHRSRLQQLCTQIGARAEHMETQELAPLPGFLRVRLGGGTLVRALTALLEDGSLGVLVGTRALLGEGWDAPSVNSLVLASFVGSFVTTNQMRGRAIRVDRKHPRKVASIWHVAAIDPESESGWSDWQDLQERFRAFVGLSGDGARIESGLARLQLPAPDAEDGFDALDAETRRRHRALGQLAAAWKNALERPGEGRVAPAVRAAHPPSWRGVHFRRTLAVLLVEAFFLFAFVQAQALRGAATGGNWRAAGLALAFATVLGALAAAPRLLHCAWLFLRHLPVDGSLHQIGLALRDALCACEVLETPVKQLRVIARTLPDKTALVYLRGGSFYEQSLFADALAEIVQPVANPRYLLSRRRRRRIGARTDWHAVPAQLGTNKERAELLLNRWRLRLGETADLIYTRSPEGRAVLLAARSRAFANATAPAVERADRWQ